MKWSAKLMLDDLDPDGYDTPYAKHLEGRLDEIEKILQRLYLAYGEMYVPSGEGKPILPLILEIEEWMGDDWYINLSDADQKRLYAIKGWDNADP